MKAAEPNIFRYNDYRAFLRDWVAFKSQTGLSLRWFARRAGFRAHNMMQLVANGQRNLSMVSIPKFTRGLGLTDAAAQYFEDLVLMNQAGDTKTRTRHYRKLVGYPERRAAIPFEASQYGFFRHWLGPVIYEMTQLAGFKADARWIARCFTPELALSEAEAVLSDLVNSGFLKRAPNGSLIPADLRLDTGDNIVDEHLYVYHEQALCKASDALHQVPGEQRHFQVMTVAVSADILPKLREISAAFEEEMWKVIDGDANVRNAVFQISLQIFPALSKPPAAPRQPRGKRK